MVLNYDCPDDVLVSRLLARAKHSGRTDDNEETIKKRLELFHSKTQPVMENYADIVVTVRKVCCLWNKDFEGRILVWTSSLKTLQSFKASQ